jgi:CPA2 family monovalent cation:H+ antiporter-2
LEEINLLMNMTLLLLVGGICSVIFRRFKMPLIIGYLATGIILANYWGGNEGTEMIVDLLSNMGLVLLMFCIGMELNLAKIRKSGAFAVMVGLIQMPLMIFGGYTFGMLLGWTALQSLFFGAIISGSSTAVVTAVLKSQGKLSKEDIEMIVLITVVEDVAQVIILSMSSPLLVGQNMDMESLVWMIATIIAFMATSVLAGIYFIPRVLDWIQDRMPDEALMMTALGLCFGMALVSVYIGMSMAIGAFLMGVIVSQSKARSVIEHDITPMKDVFMSMFFISIGLQISPMGIVDNIFLILIIFAIYAALKAGSVIIAYFVGNKSLRLSFMSSVSLVAMGEFAFIIAKDAMDAGIVSESFYTSVIGAALVSMVMLPLIANNSGRIVDYAYAKAPKPIIHAVERVEAVRSKHYSRMARASDSTSRKLKSKAFQVYADAFVLVGLETVFIVASDDLADLLYSVLLPLNRVSCYFLVMVLNYIALSIPLYTLVKNVKFMDKFFVNLGRVANSRSSSQGKVKRSSRANAQFLKLNNWVLALSIDFLILLVVPSHFGLWEHVIVISVAAAAMTSVYLYRSLRRP